MANPRVFVSSTYYDLKHVRSSLDIFIESLGYESVLSEKGDIAYSPDMPLDESCYREVTSADIFVLVIGGRYGSESSEDGRDKKRTKEFYERYESVTKKEFEEAINRDIPVYILIESNVYSEYQTYLRNKENTKISYAHVDSVNIFRFIEQIMNLPRNNPTQTFEKFSDIESWLKEQWAGLFRELLRRMSEQKKFTELSHQVDGLKEINTTLKTYLELLMRKVSPDESGPVIEQESNRLTQIEKLDALRDNRFIKYVMKSYDIEFEDIIDAIENASSTIAFANEISPLSIDSDINEDVRHLLQGAEPLEDFNEARDILGKKRLRRPPIRKD